MEQSNIYAPPTSVVEDPIETSGLAGRWTRLWGATIDGLISTVIVLPIMFATGYWDRALAESVTTQETIMISVLGLVVFLILHGYLLAKYGQTIGKRLVGTRIVSMETSEILPLWKVYLLRYLPISLVTQIPVVGIGLVYINYIFVFRNNKRCLHDQIAGTKVVMARA